MEGYNRISLSKIDSLWNNHAWIQSIYSICNFILILHKREHTIIFLSKATLIIWSCKVKNKTRNISYIVRRTIFKVKCAPFDTSHIKLINHLWDIIICILCLKLWDYSCYIPHKHYFKQLHCCQVSWSLPSILCFAVFF